MEELREADALLSGGASIAGLEVSEATYHRWRRQYGGVEVQAVKRLKGLEKENARLKKRCSGPSGRHQHLEGGR